MLHKCDGDKYYGTVVTAIGSKRCKLQFEPAQSYIKKNVCSAQCDAQSGVALTSLANLYCPECLSTVQAVKMQTFVIKSLITKTTLPRLYFQLFLSSMQFASNT